MHYKNLQAEMARKGYTRGDVSRMTGIPYSTLSDWLWPSSKVDIPVGKAKHIRNTLFPDMTVDYLFWTEEDGDD